METNYWWISINSKMLNFRDLEVGDLFYYTAYNEDNTKRTLYKNFEEIKIGEKVIVYEWDEAKQVIGLCHAVRELQDGKVMFEKIEGLTDTVPRFDIESHIELANLEVFRYTQGTLFKLSKREFEVIYSMIRELNPQKQYRYFEKYDKQGFLNDVFMSENEYDELRRLIMTMKNVVLQGAPGVGKTYIAKRMAYSILGQKDEEKILSLQFHEAFAHDEFMEGYRPDDIGIYKYKRGAFKRICNKARNNPNERYFVIIDEINRGNITKIFGEAFSLIDIDKRGKDNYVELSCSRERFYVPENLYIIGTMNTFNEGQMSNDYALRRRFCFYDIKPAYENEKFKKFCLKNDMLNKITQNIAKINLKLDDNIKIGHSYFCREMDDENLKMVVKYNIIPLIKEHYKNDQNLATDIVSRLTDIITK